MTIWIITILLTLAIGNSKKKKLKILKQKSAIFDVIIKDGPQNFKQ